MRERNNGTRLSAGLWSTTVKSFLDVSMLRLRARHRSKCFRLVAAAEQRTVLESAMGVISVAVVVVGTNGSRFLSTGALPACG